MSPRKPAPRRSLFSTVVRIFIALPLLAAVFSYSNHAGITSTFAQITGLPDVSNVAVPGMDKLIESSEAFRDLRNDAAKAVAGEVWSYAEPELKGLKGEARNAALGKLATKQLAQLEVKGRAAKTGYSRSQFGSEWSDSAGKFSWTKNGCDTRNDVLARDLTSTTFKPGTGQCVVLTGVLPFEPYTGDKNRKFDRNGGYATALDIEHIVALGNAWVTGAQKLSPAQRAAFANDPHNLMAADPSLNRQKGDADAATWLPPNKAFRCNYVYQQVRVKRSYDLWVTPAERDAMQRVIDKNC